jgi:hypothetical protein
MGGNFSSRLRRGGRTHYGLSVNLSLLEEWVALVEQIGYVDSESIRFEKVTPIRLTYWKTADFGYRVDYKYTDSSIEHLRSGSQAATAKEDILVRRFWRHYDSLIDGLGNAIG